MRIQINSLSKFKPGYIHGLKQSSVTFNLTIQESSGSKVKKINLFLDDFFKALHAAPIKNNDTSTIIDRLANLTIQLQRFFKVAVSEDYSFEKQFKDNAETYNLTLPILDLNATKATLNWAVQLFEEITLSSSFDIAQMVKDKKFTDLTEVFKKISRQSQNYFYIVSGAFKLQIPIVRQNIDLLSLGIGKNNIKMLSTITDHTSPVGIQCVLDKFKTTNLLRNAGYPAPINFPVQNINHALNIVKKIGYPIVIKPRNLDRGEGVFANITNEATLISCFKHTSKLTRQILLEKHVEGIGHRFTVLNDKVIKVTRKMPLGLIGDGESTISDLIHLKNQSKVDSPLSMGLPNQYISLDDEAHGLLNQYQLTLESVIPKDQFLPLKRKNNSTAGGSTEVLDMNDIHPDNIALAISIAKFFSLDIVGIDLITPSVQKSWLETDSVICDINSQPQTDPKTIEYILDALFPNQGRIPTHLIISGSKKYAMYEKKIHDIANQLNCNGVVTHSGIYINAKLVSKKLPSVFRSTKAILHRKELEACVILITADEIKEYGLPLDYFSSIMLDLGEIDKSSQEAFIASIKPHAKKITQK